LFATGIKRLEAAVGLLSARVAALEKADRARP